MYIAHMMKPARLSNGSLKPVSGRRTFHNGNET